jgi:hypothetical protein
MKRTRSNIQLPRTHITQFDDCGMMQDVDIPPSYGYTVQTEAGWVQEVYYHELCWRDHVNSLRPQYMEANPEEFGATQLFG